MNTYYPIRYFGDVSNMMRAYVMERARECVTRLNEEKASLSTVEQVQQYQAKMKQAFLGAIGGLPRRCEDLQPAWGELRERGDYSVQNVLFKAAPEVYVTATVWRPVGGDGLRPGLLFPCGHDEHPREEGYQEVCAEFAVNGYVTLAFDPPGQGEQKLCWDPVLETSFAGSGSAEHQHCGLQCELVGHNIARYFVQHGMAAFDLLASMPEVEATRIAVTGSSGGGTQSSFLMLADDRLAAGMPCVFTTDRWTYMQRPHWHDEEQNLTGALAQGIDYDDFYIAFAPRPAVIGAATWDFFPIEGTRLSYERAKQVYSLFGAEDRLKLVEVECPHSHHPMFRKFGVEFFNRFLQPEAEFRELRDFRPKPGESLRNTSTGQICTSIPNAKLVFELNLDEVAESRSRRRPPTREELVALLGLPRRPCPLNARVLETREEQGLTIEKSFMRTEPGIVVPVLRLEGNKSSAALLYCCDDGMERIDSQEEKLLRHHAGKGTAVYLADPRGIGETEQLSQSEGGRNMLRDIWIPQHLRMLGTSLAAQRAYDLARVLEYVRGQQGDVPIALMARGMIAWSAVIATVLDGNVKSLCLRELRPSIEEFTTERTAVIPQAYAIPGILQFADLPDLVKAGKVKSALILEPFDSLNRPLTEEQWHGTYAASWSETTAQLSVVCRVDGLQRHAVLEDYLCG
ncbi:MAG: hypothetical protein HY318_17025 [Armatimonadetes bacterium]|nr:hypothetical protein [Armatimonadota bacterium]